jgi:hypothetical protein
VFSTKAIKFLESLKKGKVKGRVAELKDEVDPLVSFWAMTFGVSF